MIYKTNRYNKNNWPDLKNRVITSLEMLIENGSIDKSTVEVMLSLVNNAVIRERSSYGRKGSEDY